MNSNRIADALGRADDYGARQHPDGLRFHLARARLRETAYDRPEKSVAAFQASLKDGRYADETAQRYGYALALLRAGKRNEAKTQSTLLLERRPSLPEFIVLDAKIDIAQGHSDQARRNLSQAVELSPANWALRTAYAEVLLEAGAGRQAFEQLETVARLRPDNAMIYELLTQAAVKSGDKGSALRYRAERLYAEGDLEPAIRQLEQALRQRDIGYHDAARMQVRLEALREELEEQKKRKDPLG